jgi:hypothetical protein
VEIPFYVEKEFGPKHPKVKAMIEGVPYRGTLVRMGSECHIGYFGIGEEETRASLFEAFGLTFEKPN